MKRVTGRCPISGRGISMNLRGVAEAEAERKEARDRHAAHYRFMRWTYLETIREVAGRRMKDEG